MSDTFQAGRITYAAQQALSELGGRLQQGLPLAPWFADPANSRNVSDLSGALNFWAQSAPQPINPEASFMARAAVGQNCAWGNLLTPAEQNWAVAKWGTEASVRVNAYASGGANVMERPAVGGGYEFVTFTDGVETWRPDVGGAADAYCAEKMKPYSLPGPLPR